MVEFADESYDVMRHEKRRARTEHCCYECSRTIGVGEHYEYATGLYDGRWDVMHTCAHCLAARAWLKKVCNGFLYGGVLVDLEEHWDESWEFRSVWLGRAVIGMRKRWTRRDGALMPVLGPPPRVPVPA